MFVTYAFPRERFRPKSCVDDHVISTCRMSKLEAPERRDFGLFHRTVGFGPESLNVPVHPVARKKWANRKT